jgi:hypothetical protein
MGQPNMKRISALGLGACLLAIMATDAGANIRGMNRIAGTINDDAGAPLAGVMIKASLDQFGGMIEEKSDDKGSWAVAGMAKGEWSVTFLKPGFTAQKAKVILPADMSRVPPIKVVLKKE